MSFKIKLEALSRKNNSLLCIGLDPDLEKIPKNYLTEKLPLFAFNKAIIDITADLVCCYKPNIAFYEAQGIDGLQQLKQTIAYIQKTYPDIPIILDAKRGDIGNTAKQYAEAIFRYWNADATTVNPYMGFDSVQPFLAYPEKETFILCKTSNAGSKDFQDQMIQDKPLFIAVAKQIKVWNDTHDNCGLVVGATWPEQLQEIRNIVKELPILVPGAGSQGGDIDATVTAGLTKQKKGLIINISRAILYPASSDEFTQAVRKATELYKEKINKNR